MIWQVVQKKTSNDCGRNVPKLRKISLFEPKKESTNRTAISERRGRRRINYSQIDLATDAENKLQSVVKMCQNGQKCYLVNQKKVKQKDSDIKISSAVGEIDRKIRKKKIKLLPKWFANSFSKNPPICAGNVPKLPKMSPFEPREKSQKRMATSKFALQ